MFKILMMGLGTTSKRDRRSNSPTLAIDALESRDLKSALAYPPDPCHAPPSDTPAIVLHNPPSETPGVVLHAPPSDTPAIVLHNPPSETPGVVLHAPPSDTPVVVLQTP